MNSSAAEHSLEESLVAARMATLRPPPRLTVSEWADRERKLSSEASAEPGQWSTARAEYLRGILDAASDPSVHTVVGMLASQAGKSEVLLNVIGFHVAQDPSPILLLEPTLEMAEALSKDRLAPMIRDTPTLQGKVGDPRTRDSGNTLLHKEFPGGRITLAGANSPASLSSRPVRIVLCDEVDRYPVSAGTEGDPVSLAKQRSATFWNRKLLLFSTPTTRGVSRIARAFEQSDQRRYFVPCGACGAFQVLEWRNVRWPSGRPDAAEYVCAACGASWAEGKRLAAVARGEWRASAPFDGTAGFHLSALYSPWTRLGELAREFLEARAHTETLKTFTNLKLAELWEEDGESVPWANLKARAEQYEQLTLPPGVLLLSAGVDVQDDRLAVLLVGWGRGEESWVVFWGELFGDTMGDEPWRELDALRTREFDHPSGAKLPIAAVAVDSGHRTQRVYGYVRERSPRVMAVKGTNQAGRAVLGRPTLQDVLWSGRQLRNGVQLWPIGTDTAKAEIYARLKIEEPGPRFIHFPAGLENDFFEQLTAERLVTRYTRGVPRLEWHLPPGKRNEVLDTLNYAYAAAIRSGVQRMDWSQVQASILAKPNDQQHTTSGPPAPGKADERLPASLRSDWMRSDRIRGWSR